MCRRIHNDHLASTAWVNISDTSDITRNRNTHTNTNIAEDAVANGIIRNFNDIGARCIGRKRVRANRNYLRASSKGST